MTQSALELKSMGSPALPEVAVDPALSLAPAPREDVDSAYHDKHPYGRALYRALRPWPGFEEKADCFAHAAGYAGVRPQSVFITIDRTVTPGELACSFVCPPRRLFSDPVTPR